MSFYNNTPQVKKMFEKLCKEALKEIGITAKADLQSNCVVKSGTLKRNHHYRVISKDTVILGVSVHYAKYVEFKPYSAGGRPWFRQTLQSDNQVFQNIIRKHLGGLGS